MSHNRFLALALVLPFGFAFAQSVAPSTPGPTAFPVSTVRNISTIGPTTVSPANVGRYAFANAIGGNVVADAATGLPLPDGRTSPVNVTSTIPKASVASALGRFARKALPILSTGIALYDLAEELGYKASTTGGPVVFEKQDMSVEPSSGTYYRAANGPYVGSAWTAPQACKIAIASGGGVYTGYLPAESRCTGTKGGFPFGANVGPHPSGNPYPCPVGQFSNGTSCSTTRPVVPSTPAQFEADIAAKSDWQPSSALARSLVDAIKAGELVQAQPQTVTGPASTPGASSTTTDAVNGTTTTTTNTFNHVYDGAKVTTTLTTTNLTINTSTGAVVSNTTTTASPVMPEADPDDEDGTPTDTALPGQPDLYDPEYPEGLKGVWNAKKAQLQDVPLLNLLGDLMPTVSGSGTCPSWPLDLDLYIVDYGVHLVQVPCWIWDFGKVVIICSALLLSRRLIFGG